MMTKKQLVQILQEIAKKSNDKYCDVDTLYSKISFEETAKTILKEHVFMTKKAYEKLKEYKWKYEELCK